MSKKFILHYPKYQNIVEQYLNLDEFCGKATETIRSKRVTIIAFCNYLGDNVPTKTCGGFHGKYFYTFLIHQKWESIYFASFL